LVSTIYLDAPENFGELAVQATHFKRLDSDLVGGIS
jgi:hypothetical protein